MTASPLFESGNINALTLKNRFVRSATWEGMASVDGRVTAKLIDTMVALARGGVGLIVTEGTLIDHPAANAYSDRVPRFHGDGALKISPPAPQGAVQIVHPPAPLEVERVTGVEQLRLVVEANDFDEAVEFYRDVLGLPEEFHVESEGEARVIALQAGRATLEIVNPAQRRLIDQLEVGREVSRSIRVAFEVTNATLATDRLAAAGAELIAPPTQTPWRSLNSRLEAPAGLQITLFEELDPAD